VAAEREVVLRLRAVPNMDPAAASTRKLAAELRAADGEAKKLGRSLGDERLPPPIARPGGLGKGAVWGQTGPSGDGGPPWGTPAGTAGRPTLKMPALPGGGKGAMASAGAEAGEGAAGAEAGEGAAGAAGGLAAVAGPVGIAIAAAIGLGRALKGLADKALSMAEAANPAQSQRFQMMLADVSAVIGQRFGPMLEFATKVGRLFGDFLQTILPSEAEMQTLFAELQPALDDFKGALREIAPILKDGLKGGLMFAVAALKAFVGFIKPFLKMFGDGKKKPDLKSSVDQAPRPAKFQGIEDVGREAAERALSAAGGTQDPVEANTAAMSELSKRMDEAVAKLGEVIKFFNPWLEPLQKLAQWLGEPGNKEKVVEGATNAANTTADLFGGVIGWPSDWRFGK